MSPIVALLAALVAAPAPVPAQNCFASDTSACRAEQAARQARLYRLPSLERLARDGVTARRAFFFNEHGQDVGAIVFSRRRGEPPRLTVLRPDGAGPDRALSVAIPETAWRQALGAGRGFDGPERPLTAGDEQMICFDSWAVRVEAADPPRAPRRAVSATCPGGPAVGYAYELAARALTLLPVCALLESHYFAGDITRLSFCTALSGDRRMAAHAANAAFALVNVEAEALPAMFADDARLDWNGDHADGRAAASARLLRAFAERERLFYQPLYFAGHADGSAEVTGKFSEYVQDDDNDRLGYRVDEAPATLHLRRGADGRFRIVQARIGPFVRRVYRRPRP